jgi:hypothetical protein
MRLHILAVTRNQDGCGIKKMPSKLDTSTKKGGLRKTAFLKPERKDLQVNPVKLR